MRWNHFFSFLYLFATKSEHCLFPTHDRQIFLAWLGPPLRMSDIPTTNPEDENVGYVEADDSVPPPSYGKLDTQNLEVTDNLLQKIRR